MPGPTDSDDALRWIREAMETGNYRTHPHFEKRCAERRFSIQDAKRIVRTATSCVSYESAVTHRDGTPWRVFGSDASGDAAMLGVEAYRDHLGERVLLLTIMDGG